MATVYDFAPQPGGAGTGVRVTDTSPSVSPGRLGVTVLLGAFTKGISLVTSRLLDKTHARRVVGRPIKTGSYTGQAIGAFFDCAQGAGELHAFRVPASTGLEDEVGSLRLLARRCLASRVEARAVDGANERTIALRAYALSPGDWSGPGFHFGGKVDDTTIDGSTIELSTDYTGIWLADELIGAIFTIPSWGVEMTVTGNTAGDDSNGPVLTLSRGFAGYTATGGDVLFTLHREAVDADGAAMAAAVTVSDGGSAPASTTRLEVSLDGSAVRSFDGVDLTDLAALTEEVNGAIVAGYAEVGFDATGQTIDDDGAPENRPCNWSGIALPDDANLGKALVSNGRLYLQVHELIVDTAAGGIPKLSAVPTLPTDVRPHVYEITFSNATTAAVTVTDPYTGEEMVPAAEMPALTTGSAYKGPVVSGTGLGFLSTFTIVADGTISAGTIVRLYVLPLPSNLRGAGGRLFASAWSGAGYTPTNTDPGSNPAKPATSLSFAIVDNGADWVKVASGGLDLSTAIQAPKAPWIRGTNTDASIDTTGGKTLKLQAIIDGNAETVVTVTIPEGGGTITKAALATLLNADGGFNAIAYAEVDSSNRLVCWMNRGDAGALAALKFTDGTVNSAIGVTDNTSNPGQDGAPVRVQFAQALRGARYEAAAVTSDDLVSALEINPDSALASFIQATPSVVTLILPGEAAAVQDQAIAFANEYGCWLYLDLPDSITSELAATAYRRETHALDAFAQWAFPSRGRTVRSPRVASGRELVPLSSALAGAAARWANDPTEGRGFHKPLAGLKAPLSPYIGALERDPASSPTPAQLLAAPRVRDDLLNPGGILPVTRSGALVYPFGDEILAPTGLGTVWAHKAKAVLHIVGLLRANGAQFVYRLNNPDLRLDVLDVATALLEPLFRAGWFDPLEDGLALTFPNCVALQCDSTNNPSAIADAGQLVCSVRFRIVNVAKVVEFQIGTRGLNVGVV